jgi:hypothetical protein
LDGGAFFRATSHAGLNVTLPDLRIGMMALPLPHKAALKPLQKHAVRQHVLKSAIRF